MISSIVFVQIVSIPNEKLLILTNTVLSLSHVVVIGLTMILSLTIVIVLVSHHLSMVGMSDVPFGHLVLLIASSGLVSLVTI